MMTLPAEEHDSISDIRPIGDTLPIHMSGPFQQQASQGGNAAASKKKGNWEDDDDSDEEDEVEFGSPAQQPGLISSLEDDEDRPLAAARPAETLTSFPPPQSQQQQLQPLQPQQQPWGQPLPPPQQQPPQQPVQQSQQPVAPQEQAVAPPYQPSSDLRAPAAQPTVAPAAPVVTPPAAPAAAPQSSMGQASAPSAPASPSAQCGPAPPKPQGPPPPLTAEIVAPSKPQPPVAPARGGDMWDNHAASRPAPSPTKAAVQNQAPPVSLRTYESARGILRSTLVNHIASVVALLLAIVVSLVGFARMTEDAADAGRPITATAFLASQAWALSGKIRDHRLGTVAFSEHAPDDPIAFVQPRCQDFVQVGSFFTSAVVFAILAIVWVEVSAEWVVFSLLMMLWVTNNAIVCCRDFRDRLESTVWNETIPERMRVELHRILSMCGGTLDYKISVFATFGLACLTIVSWIWGGFDEDELQGERKALLTIAVVYNIASNFYLSKLIYDHKPSDQSNIAPPTKALMVGNWCIAMLVPTLCIFMMIEDDDGSFWLFTCLLVTSNSTLHVAKVLYDREQVALLLSEMATTSSEPSNNAGYQASASVHQKASRVAPQWGSGQVHDGQAAAGNGDFPTELLR